MGKAVMASQAQGATERPTADTNRPVKVAYIMSRFPKLTETFILYEILEMRQLGVPVEVFPLLRERQKVVHPEAEEVTKTAHFHPFISLAILWAHLYFLFRRPVTYCKMIVEVLTGTFGSTNFFVGAMGILPKVVRFAYEMQQLGVTHVHAHFATHPTVAALIIHRLIGLPFSFTAHGSDLHVDKHMLDKKIDASAFAITCSSFNKEIMLKEAGEALRHKIHVIYYGIEPDLFVGSFKKKMHGPYQIICVASFEEVKGHKYLVEACRLLRERGVDFECHFVGDGPLRPQVEKQIAAARLTDKIVLHGMRTRHEVARMLQEADVKVLASFPTAEGKREGMPNVLIEAMAAELPVISTAISGIPELVDDERTGILVPPCDASALADALQRLGDHPALRQRMGQTGREKVVRYFDRKTNATTLAQLFVGVDTTMMPVA